jgi:hypothetical protein
VYRAGVRRRIHRAVPSTRLRPSPAIGAVAPGSPSSSDRSGCAR